MAPALEGPPASRSWLPRRWLPQWSEAAAVRAVRATIVMPGLFAVGLVVLDNLQLATYVAFGSFSTLVLVSFGGSRWDRVVAHASMAAVGSVLIVIGTLASQSAVAAALVALPVAFVVLFSGVTGPNAAAAGTATLVAYVLPASAKAPLSVVPDRLAGWLLAAAVGTAAVLATIPRHVENRLRNRAARTAAALAEELGAAAAGGPGAELRAATARAVAEMHEASIATPIRPIGFRAPSQALTSLSETLEWCNVILGEMASELGGLRVEQDTDREMLVRMAAVLVDVAELLDGGSADPDLDGLERSRRAAAAYVRGLPDDTPDYSLRLHCSYHLRMAAVAVVAVGTDSLILSRRASAAMVAAERARWYGESPTGTDRWSGARAFRARLADHAGLRSVWFRNSLRGAAALAGAVAIADALKLQHGFWVVLGTLSVLRSNATTTGATVVRALIGTVAGFAIGSALVVGIGSNTAVLWAVLPVAVLVAAYAPGTAPFAVGQAAFTVTIFVLYNLIVPVGWEVGAVRVEDVAFGCAISLVAGLLFWPRGASVIVADDLADAYRVGARYLVQAVDDAVGRADPSTTGSAPAIRAALRLDSALRGYAAEQGAKRISKDSLRALVAGATRLRLTGDALSGMPASAPHEATVADTITGVAHDLGAWYEQLASHLGPPATASTVPLRIPRLDPLGELAAAGPVGRSYAVWIGQHLAHLRGQLGELIGPAEQFAALRRRPWWR
jgi:uncharacterized membrane protein YccC